MRPRLIPNQVAPESYGAVATLSAKVESSGIEPSLLRLIELRASQINGCAFCMHMHARGARRLGEKQERLDVLAGWRESPLFSERERAALAWTETLTLVAQTRAPDDVYEAAVEVLGEVDLVKITVAIGLINVWNRIAVGFRTIHPVEG